MATWTGHRIDDIRCVTCLGMKKKRIVVAIRSMLSTVLSETYRWTIEKCGISIDKSMH